MIVNPGATITAARGNSFAPDNKYWTSVYSYYNSPFQYAYPSPTPFLTASYIINTTPNQLLSTNSTDFRNNGAVVVGTTYSYADGTTTYNRSAVTTTTSDGATRTDRYYYPTSTSIPNLNSTQQTMVNTLSSNNRLTTVVEKSSFKNSTPLNSEIYQYQDWGNNIITPQSVFTQKGTDPFEIRLQYHNYDAKGNIQSVSKENGPKINYIYGYGGNYPVAQVTNVDYATVQAVLGGQAAVESFRDNTSPTDPAVNAFLAPLRTIAGAQVATYTYAPLIGITSATDAKGITTTYEYDSFQRLMNIRDKDGKIVKHMDYHYKP